MYLDNPRYDAESTGNVGEYRKVDSAPISMTDYFGNATSYEYDGKNQIMSIAEKYNGTSGQKTTTYQYNENGSLAQVNIPNNMRTDCARQGRPATIRSSITTTAAM